VKSPQQKKSAFITSHLQKLGRWIFFFSLVLKKPIYRHSKMFRHSIARQFVQYQRCHLIRNTRIANGLKYKSSLAEAASMKPVKDANDNLDNAINLASQLVQPKRAEIDPFKIVAKEMSTLALDIGKLMGSGHPLLNRVAMYYFQSEGKHVRPLIVLTLSKALSAIPKSERTRATSDETYLKSRPSGIDDSISPLNILHGIDPLKRALSTFKPGSSELSDEPVDGISPKQRRLAEIVEIIHTASLLHDDVIDNSATRRGSPSGNIAFGNKMAILAGDFLLGTASVAISRLRNAEVIELLSTTMANLVEGEFMQLKNTAVDSTSEANRASFEYYIHKTYLKTASLMSKSCRATAVLSGASDEIVDASYNFGKNLGLCFQIVDDMLDYTVSEKNLGKPAGADLKLGLATAPVLFAWETYPELGNMIRRQFNQPGDVEMAREYVEKAGGLERTRELAVKYANDAIKELEKLPDSDARSALINLTHVMINRKH